MRHHHTFPTLAAKNGLHAALEKDEEEEEIEEAYQYVCASVPVCRWSQSVVTCVVHGLEPALFLSLSRLWFSLSYIF